MLQKPPPPLTPPPSKPTTTTKLTTKCKATTLLLTLLILLLLLSLSSTSPQVTTPTPSRDLRLFPTTPPPYILNTTTTTTSVAYFVTGSSGDLSSIFRLLLSIYHPNNLYLVHIDRFAPQSDRDRLAIWVSSLPVFRAARNVHVVGNPDFVYVKGSSPLSSLLRGVSILLRLSHRWDWFINLSPHHYPFLTQDDLLHVLSYLPKDLNFVNHTGYIGWKESRRLKPIIVDPGLYLSEKSAMFYATQKRDLPSAYQMFSGSPTSVLNRKFMEYCILGSDNLPRTLLMYLANTQSSLLNYVPTILCNSQEFKETVVNHNLQYSRENPRQQLNLSDFNAMIQSGSAFGTKFRQNDPILDRIDREILGRAPGKVVPGGWCLGESNDACQVWGDATILRPGPGAKRLEKRIVSLLSNGAYQSQQCISQ
ncbi:hypothetical protein RND81_14G066700 [Saponaria officinalis]|uniref:Uncharacterized protein n=1 Tax=Saponaria officinalis TaxID=3572 RepID=A0AAW1GLS3_SAPOF